MYGLIALVVFAALVIASLVFGGLYYRSRRQGPIASEHGAEVEQGGRHISLLTEAVAYVGAILVLAGGITAIGQRWGGIGNWGHVAIFAGAAVFFLLVGIAVRRVSEPAIQRLVGVTWFLSVGGVAGAVGFATLSVRENPTRYTALAVGGAVTVYAAILWLVRRRALQDVALFVGLVVTTCGIIVAVADPAPSLAFALALWALGLAWAGAGWQRYIEPIWVTIPLGAFLALLAPDFAVGNHGWMYAIGIGTAAAAMAVSIPLRNTPLLALGALAMFGYVTGAAITYFHESLGVPGALAITGVLVIGLAVVTARLMRVTHPPQPKKPGPEPAATALPPKPAEPGEEEPAPRDLPKAS